MTLWFWIIVASVVAFLTKLLGYLVPRRLLRNPRIVRIAGTLTIGLLAALTMANTVANGQHLAGDARLGALGAAVIATPAQGTVPGRGHRRSSRCSGAATARRSLTARRAAPVFESRTAERRHF